LKVIASRSALLSCVLKDLPFKKPRQLKAQLKLWPGMRVSGSGALCVAIAPVVYHGLPVGIKGLGKRTIDHAAVTGTP